MAIMHRSRAYDSALELQDKLHALATTLAGEIAKPAQKRDAEAVRERWADIERLRAPLTAIAREIERDGMPHRGRYNRKDYDLAREIHDHGRLLRKRLRDWSSIGDVVMRHIEFEPVQLLDPNVPHEEDPLLKMLDTAFHKLANLSPQDMDAREALSCFPDIPMPARTFDALMNAAYRLLLAQGRAKEARFIDIGCGGGTRSFLASRYFRVCDGLEYDEGYAKAGQRFMEFMGHADMNVFLGDGLTFDRYAEYDVIYFYRPMFDLDLLGQLERKIIGDARPGTIILAPWDAFYQSRDEIDCAKIVSPIYVAGLTQDDADTLHKAAECTDTRVVAAARDWSYDPGFWTPILDASSYDMSST